MPDTSQSKNKDEAKKRLRRSVAVNIGTANREKLIGFLELLDEKVLKDLDPVFLPTLEQNTDPLDKQERMVADLIVKDEQEGDLLAKQKSEDPLKSREVDAFELAVQGVQSYQRANKDQRRLHNFRKYLSKVKKAYPEQENLEDLRYEVLRAVHFIDKRVVGEKAQQKLRKVFTDNREDLKKQYSADIQTAIAEAKTVYWQKEKKRSLCPNPYHDELQQHLTRTKSFWSLKWWRARSFFRNVIKPRITSEVIARDAKTEKDGEVQFLADCDENLFSAREQDCYAKLHDGIRTFHKKLKQSGNDSVKQWNTTMEKSLYCKVPVSKPAAGQPVKTQPKSATKGIVLFRFEDLGMFDTAKYARDRGYQRSLQDAAESASSRQTAYGSESSSQEAADSAPLSPEQYSSSLKFENEAKTEAMKMLDEFIALTKYNTNDGQQENQADIALSVNFKKLQQKFSINGVNSKNFGIDDIIHPRLDCYYEESKAEWQGLFQFLKDKDIEIRLIIDEKKCDIQYYSPIGQFLKDFKDFFPEKCRLFLGENKQQKKLDKQVENLKRTGVQVCIVETKKDLEKKSKLSSSLETSGSDKSQPRIVSIDPSQKNVGKLQTAIDESFSSEGLDLFVSPDSTPTLV